MATNAVYPSFDIDRAGIDIIPSYRYASLPFIHWLIQVAKTSIKTSKVCSVVKI